MSMEETAVLLSIRPEWCQKIFRGEKTMEIRKNFPKDFQGQPFKCFIYCTKGQNAGFRMEPDGSLLRLDGTVIGEFTCDRVYEIAPLNHAPDDLEAQACMDRDQIWKYTHGKGYAWHITELKTYETPLDLAAFHLRCENALRWCNNGGCAMHIERPANGNCCGNYGLQLNRPPQSWCYVVSPGECHKELQEQMKATLNRLYPRKKVSDILPKPEILGQLAEELAEASAFCLHFDLKEAATMPEKSEFDKALGELYDLTEWENAEAALRELHARQPEMERLYIDGKILPGELQALVMVNNCLEREFIHRQLATGQPLHLNI
jgi:predicted transcriptional regulator